ncbi:hypothetical protein LFM09_26440 [Lentzea alba]|uniref:hypothetical protein n=1 Tax=Lentzea alba TaxID=2714351 RepID=UPI0039BEDA75
MPAQAGLKRRRSRAALPRTALPRTALPRTALPRTALPRTALPRRVSPPLLRDDEGEPSFPYGPGGVVPSPPQAPTQQQAALSNRRAISLRVALAGL